jgi:hypothetical protein
MDLNLNATEVLKEALKERDEEKRIHKISIGCKLIIEILPFESRSLRLLEQSHLVKYLILV